MRRIAALVLAAVALLVVVAQLVLPGVAERRITSDLARYGPRPHVEVDALPALDLLLHHADSVRVRMVSARSGSGPLAALLARTADTDELDVTVDELLTGALTLRHVTLAKDGSRLTGTATVTAAALRAALPPALHVSPVPDAGGDGLVLEGRGTMLGFSAAVRVRIRALDGRVVVQPEGLPLGGLAAITVFEDPRVAVTAVRARPGSGGFVLSADALLR